MLHLEFSSPEQRSSSLDVYSEVLALAFERLSDSRKRAQVDDSDRPAERAAQRFFIEKRTVYHVGDGNMRGYVASWSGGKGYGVVTILRQVVNECSADETECSGDQNAHGHQLSRASRWSQARCRHAVDRSSSTGAAPAWPGPIAPALRGLAPATTASVCVGR